MGRRRSILLLLAALLAPSALAAPPHAPKTHRHAAPAIASRHAPHKACSHKVHAKASVRRRTVRRARVAAPLRHKRSRAGLRSAAEERRPFAPRSLRRNASLNRLAAMPPPLRGTYASLVRQNERTQDDGLERILDDHDLSHRIASHMLVPVPVSAGLAINKNLPAERRYCRPWTARFLADLARAHAAAFHRPFEVTSAVRTVAYQKKLMRVNGNATSAVGEVVSPHVTGAAVDIAKGDMTRQELAWFRRRLLALQEAGKIDVEEEFEQTCFHVTVYKSYLMRPQSAPATRSTDETGPVPPSAPPGSDDPLQQAARGR